MGVMRTATHSRLRLKYLKDWGTRIGNDIQAGVITGKPVAVQHWRIVPGPRSGAVELLLGVEAGRVMRALTRDRCAVLRQYVPWDFQGHPLAFMSGRYLRLEAGWDEHLAQGEVRLSDISHKPERDNAWIAGKSETGATVIPHLDDLTPHYLFAGSTGAGKPVALRSAVHQLASAGGCRFALIDGKWGDGLGCVGHLNGILGPCATRTQDARAALGWVAAEMRRRYEEREWDKRLIVAVDEFHEFVEDDAVFAGLLRKIAVQGRAVDVHLLAATHHPTVGMFGDPETKREFKGRIVLLVTDNAASQAAIGDSVPRADYLLDAGDSYTGRIHSYHRTQLVMVDREIEAASNGYAWQFDEWPAYDPHTVGRELSSGNGGGRVREPWTAGELATAMAAAIRGWGRPNMLKYIAPDLAPDLGETRGRDVLDLAREVCDLLEGQGYVLKEAE